MRRARDCLHRSRVGHADFYRVAGVTLGNFLQRKPHRHFPLGFCQLAARAGLRQQVNPCSRIDFARFMSSLLCHARHFTRARAVLPGAAFLPWLVKLPEPGKRLARAQFFGRARAKLHSAGKPAYRPVA